MVASAATSRDRPTAAWEESAVAYPEELVVACREVAPTEKHLGVAQGSIAEMCVTIRVR
ncbi:hypothetical protein V7S43_004391 [Phytophthora oleae]|uniref:Uncharacterized protein n=1 Tax=Phytophthora oleae TaxID=2107226 RepID=A0ABD3FWF5_9STRA